MAGQDPALRQAVGADVGRGGRRGSQWRPVRQGDQLLTVNDEQQKIQVKGRVRPQDISPGNVVLSTRLAEAEIVYIGEGELAGRQRPSWWARFLNWLGF